MNQEAKHVLEELIKTRKGENMNWQPSKVVQDTLDYVSRLPSARNSMVINNLRGCGPAQCLHIYSSAPLAHQHSAVLDK